MKILAESDDYSIFFGVIRQNQSKQPWKQLCYQYCIHLVYTYNGNLRSVKGRYGIRWKWITSCKACSNKFRSLIYEEVVGIITIIGYYYKEKLTFRVSNFLPHVSTVFIQSKRDSTIIQITLQTFQILTREVNHLSKKFFFVCVRENKVFLVSRSYARMTLFSRFIAAHFVSL